MRKSNIKYLFISLTLLFMLGFSGCKKSEADIKDVKRVAKDLKNVNVNTKKIKNISKTVTDVEKRVQCEKALVHIVKLTLDDPKMKEQFKKDPTSKEKFQKQMSNNKEKSLTQCVAQFNQKSMNCLMKSKTIKDVATCAPKK